MLRLVFILRWIKLESDGSSNGPSSMDLGILPVVLRIAGPEQCVIVFMDSTQTSTVDLQGILPDFETSLLHDSDVSAGLSLPAVS